MRRVVAWRGRITLRKRIARCLPQFQRSGQGKLPSETPRECRPVDDDTELRRKMSSFDSCLCAGRTGKAQRFTGGKREFPGGWIFFPDLDVGMDVNVSLDAVRT